MAIVVTGTPGTGKSTYANKLGEELDRPVLNVTDLCEQHGLDDEWDAARQCFVVDVEKLTSLLEERVEQDPELIIDGHLAHELDPQYVDRCVVMKCDLATLKERLESRGYSEAKVRENLDCEIFDVCRTEALERGHDVEIVWSE